MQHVESDAQAKSPARRPPALDSGSAAKDVVSPASPPTRGPSRIDLDCLQIPPLQLTWRFTYQDYEQEMAQVNAELRPLFAKRMQFNGTVLCGLTLLIGAYELLKSASTDGANDAPVEDGAVYIVVFACATALALVACTGRYADVLRLRLRVLEGVAVSALLVLTIAVTMATSTERMRAAFGVAPTLSKGFVLTRTQQLLRLSLLMMGTSTYMPMQPVAFSAYVLATVGIVVVGIRLDERALDSAETSDMYIFCAVAFTVIANRIYVVHSRRGQWHFRNAVSRALEELAATERVRGRLEAQEVENRTMALTALAAKVARGRLIRMVRLRFVGRRCLRCACPAPRTHPACRRLAVTAS